MDRPIALSPKQIKTVWESMLASEVRANYFAELSQKLANEQKVITWGSLVLSSSAFGAVVVSFPYADVFRVGLTFLASMVSLYSLVQQNSKRAIDASDLHARWLRLSHDYENLWNDMYSDSAPSQLQSLKDLEVEVSKASISLPNDEGLMLKWENYVVAQHSS